MSHSNQLLIVGGLRDVRALKSLQLLFVPRRRPIKIYFPTLKRYESKCNEGYERVTINSIAKVGSHSRAILCFPITFCWVLESQKSRLKGVQSTQMNLFDPALV